MSWNPGNYPDTVSNLSSEDTSKFWKEQIDKSKRLTIYCPEGEDLIYQLFTDVLTGNPGKHYVPKPGDWVIQLNQVHFRPSREKMQGYFTKIFTSNEEILRNDPRNAEALKFLQYLATLK